MARAWVKRWSPHRNGGKGSLVPALIITPESSIESMTWNLPPSKSHAIRWLALAAQSNQSLRLENMGAAGQDIISMRRCLRQLGVRITDLDASGHPIPVESNHDDQPPAGTASWIVEGAGPHGLRAPVSVLHAGNSGTALRILMAMCARFDVPIMVDGDASLRSRNHDVMVAALEALGVTVSRGVGVEGLPLLLQGPWKPTEELSLDVSTSSQPTTAFCLAAPALTFDVKVEAVGDGVSLRHSELSKDLCVQTGADEALRDGTLQPWTPTFKESSVRIPPDASMLAFACLAAKVCRISVHVEDLPTTKESLGHDVLMAHLGDLGLKVEGSTFSGCDESAPASLDLKHGNDLITPVAALLALGAGGTIIGAEHAAFKETDRTNGTVALLAQFGLKSTFENGRLIVPGGQTIVGPKGLVETYGDHRMHMTALVLAMGSSTPVLIEGDSLHEVADPEAIARWEAVGVVVERVLHEPW
ncbi:MAG: 3-phosphoshikimate 1-carboxyvinyltransferase [Poseidonia sp.]